MTLIFYSHTKYSNFPYSQNSAQPMATRYFFIYCKISLFSFRLSTTPVSPFFLHFLPFFRIKVHMVASPVVT